MKQVLNTLDKLAEALSQLAESQAQMMRMAAAPRRLIRDPNTNQISGSTVDLAELDSEGSA